MTPIYNASTLRKVSSESCLAKFNYVRDNYVPEALCKINEANFAAASDGRNSSCKMFDFSTMGLTTQELQHHFRIGLKTELEALGLKVDILMKANNTIDITCRW